MLVPASLSEVVCPKTMVKELRKVAKLVLDKQNLETYGKSET